MEASLISSNMEWATLRVVSLLSLGVSKEEIIKEQLGDHNGLKEGWWISGGLENKSAFFSGDPQGLIPILKGVMNQSKGFLLSGRS